MVSAADTTGQPLTLVEYREIQAALRAGVQGKVLAQRYNLNRAYVSRIGKGKAHEPRGLRTRTVRGRRFQQGVRRMLTLQEYQAIRAVWREGLVVIGLDPDHLPEDFTPRDVAAELRDAGVLSQQDIARQFGVSCCTVNAIVRGQRLHPDERRGHGE